MLLNPIKFVKCFQDFKLPTLSIFISILSKLLQPSNLLSFFFLSSIKHYSFFSSKEGCENKSFRDLNRKSCLVANRRRRRRFPCLMANGRRKRSSFSPLLIFPPTNFTQTFILSFDLKLLLYHGSRLLLMHFLPFL